MLPRSDSLLPDPVKKPKSLPVAATDDCPDHTHHHHHRSNSNTAFQSLHVYISARPRTWLVLTILSLQLILLLSARSLPISSPTSRRSSNGRRSGPSPSSSASSSGNDTMCEYGRVYVYDLPPMFNKELVDGCDDLNPWNSRCDALSNGGFGRRSTDLAGIVPDALLPAWYATDQFAAELIYHNRMLRHPCRTPDPSAAAAFYVPFYAGLAVGKYLWSADNNYTARDRDRHAQMLLHWIADQAPWRRSNGWDHFIMLGRITWDFRRSRDWDWGGSFLYMPEMENVTRLLIERNPWDHRDVGVPYPTGFHPRTRDDVLAWQAYVLNRTRSALFCFAGAARARFKDDFRGVLLGQCQKEKEGSGKCRSLDCSGTRCSNRTGDTLGLFLDSAFCLQPRGDSFTRRSTFDCMVAGSIPVFFWRRSAYVQYGWFLPPPSREEEYSVFIDRRAVRNGSVEIGRVLEELGEERVRRMRERVVGMIPRLVYAQPGWDLAYGEEDAFDVALNGVLRMFREQKVVRTLRSNDTGTEGFVGQPSNHS